MDDAAHRTTVEDALRESEARFRALLSAIDEGYCLCEVILDDAGRPVDYRFLEANANFETMTGLVGAVGHTAYELVADLEPFWAETYGRVALGGESLRFRQGSAAMGRWFDVFATAVEPHGRFALVFDDVTEWELAEVARRDAEAAERRARVQAELLAELHRAVDVADAPQAHVERLAELLVTDVADVARVELPGPDGPVTGQAARPPAARLEDADVRADAPIDVGTAELGSVALGFSGPDRVHPGPAAGGVAPPRPAHLGLLVARARVREEEHRIALRLQQALLPAEVLRRDGLEIAARYAAGGDVLEVGGDFYDTFALPGGRVGLAVGDVVGHGLEAAATMGRLRTALGALAPHAEGPSELLSHLDAYAVGTNGVGFATVCYAVLDPVGGELRHASAGHPPMLVVPPVGAPTWLEDGRSPPLHDVPQAGREEAATTLAPGSLLLLFSDGLVERRGESLRVGLERLRVAADAARALPLPELCDHLLAELGTAEDREDDVVVLCLRLVV